MLYIPASNSSSRQNFVLFGFSMLILGMCLYFDFLDRSACLQQSQGFQLLSFGIFQRHLVHFQRHIACFHLAWHNHPRAYSKWHHCQYLATNERNSPKKPIKENEITPTREPSRFQLYPHRGLEIFWKVFRRSASICPNGINVMIPTIKLIMMGR